MGWGLGEGGERWGGGEEESGCYFVCLVICFNWIFFFFFFFFFYFHCRAKELLRQLIGMFESRPYNEDNWVLVEMCKVIFIFYFVLFFYFFYFLIIIDKIF